MRIGDIYKDEENFIWEVVNENDEIVMICWDLMAMQKVDEFDFSSVVKVESDKDKDILLEDIEEIAKTTPLFDFEG